MQEQSFEKQVREKLEELSFVPSRSVWQHVEKGLHKKRERRKVVFWALPLLLVPACFFIWQQTVKEPSSTNITKLPSSGSLPGATSAGGNTNTSEVEIPRNTGFPAGHKTPVGPENAGTGLSAAGGRPSGKGLGREQQPDATAAGYAATTSPGGSGHRTATAKEAYRNQHDGGMGINRKTSAGKEDIFKGTKEWSTGERKESHLKPGRSAASFIAGLVLPQPGLPDSLAKRSSLPVPEPQPAVAEASQKWQWSVQAGAGLSGIAFSGKSSAATVGNADPSFAAMLPSAPAPPSAPEVSGAVSFSSGFRLARKVTDRFSLTAGVVYQFYRTQITMDQSYDPSVAGGASRVSAAFYQDNVKSKYTNRYHLVELPLGVEYRLLRNFPLNAHAGVSLGRMVAADALSYQEATGAYQWENSSRYRQTQAAAFGELTCTVVRIGKASLAAGPAARFGLTPLKNDKGGKRQSLYFTGINARLNF